MKIKDVEFNTNDLGKMVKLMKHYKDFPMPLSGKNEVGENIIISINKDNITVQTCQNNGWLRTNVYYSDGVVEELYER